MEARENLDCGSLPWTISCGGLVKTRTPLPYELSQTSHFTEGVRSGDSGKPKQVDEGIKTVGDFFNFLLGLAFVVGVGIGLIVLYQYLLGLISG